MAYRKQLYDKDGNKIYPVLGIDTFYPVGSIYMSATLSTVEQVEETLGGEWEAWGSGRVPVGVDANQTEFNTVDKTGGTKEYNLSANAGAANSDAGTYAYITEGATTYQSSHSPSYVVHGSFTSGGSWNHSTPVTIKNSANRATTNLQPYITCYMYKRIA